METIILKSVRQSVFRPADNASVLLLVLWSLMFLSALALISSAMVRQKLMLVYRLDERDTLQHIADAGALWGIAQLRKVPLEKEYCALKDTWSSNPALFKEAKIGSQGVATIGYSYVGMDGAKGFRFGLIDEARKININTSSAEVLARLFQIAGALEPLAANDLALSIIDWRDTDSNLSSPTGGAEDSYYMIGEFPYQAKDGEFEILEEALLVRGMSEELFARIKEHITIYGDGRVNINTAAPLVLMALGIPQGVADKIVCARMGADGVEATPDDLVFMSPAEIVPVLKNKFRLTKSEEEQLIFISENYLCVDSVFFTVKSSAHLLGKKSQSERVCVFDRDGKVFYWQGA